MGTLSPEEFALKIIYGEKVPLPSEMGKDIEWAKKACEKLAQLFVKDWGEVIGLKAGLTSVESQKKFGGGPIYGPLHEKNVVYVNDDVTITINGTEALVEVEVSVVDDERYIAIELPENRYGVPWEKLKAVDIQADLGGEGKVLLISPFKDAASTGTIMEGRIVRPLKEHGEYILVTDPSGRKGWLNKNLLGFITALPGTENGFR